MKQDPVAVFCRAVWRGEKKVVASLAPVVDPNGRDRWGHAPLSMAAQYGDASLVALLVKRGADVNDGRQFLTPITLAARRGESASVEFLQNAGAALSVFTWTHLAQDDLIARELSRAG